MKTKQEKRESFRAWIGTQVRYANGYYYIGDYQPATNTGRFFTKEAAIRSQMDAADRWHLQGHSDAYDHE